MISSSLSCSDSLRTGHAVRGVLHPSRSAVWRQIQADVYGQAVETVRAEEGAAYGAALLAGVGAGVWKSVDAACDQVVQVAARTPAKPDAVAILEESYRRYRRIYPALRSVFG